MSSSHLETSISDLQTSSYLCPHSSRNQTDSSRVNLNNGRINFNNGRIAKMHNGCPRQQWLRTAKRMQRQLRILPELGVEHGLFRAVWLDDTCAHLSDVCLPEGMVDPAGIPKAPLTRNEVVLLGRRHGLSVGTRVLCPPNRRRPPSAGVCLRNLLYVALPTGSLV